MNSNHCKPLPEGACISDHYKEARGPEEIPGKQRNKAVDCSFKRLLVPEASAETGLVHKLPASLRHEPCDGPSRRTMLGMLHLMPWGRAWHDGLLIAPLLMLETLQGILYTIRTTRTGRVWVYMRPCRIHIINSLHSQWMLSFQSHAWN